MFDAVVGIVGYFGIIGASVYFFLPTKFKDQFKFELAQQQLRRDGYPL